MPVPGEVDRWWRRRGRAVKHINPSELDAPSLGSTYDPVLTGVASGLTRLFPPIDNHPRAQDEDGETHDDLEADDRRS